MAGPPLPPPQGSHVLKKLMEENPDIKPGEGRTIAFQALVQVMSHRHQRDLMSSSSS